MRVPTSTYRVQLNADATLSDAAAVVGDLDALGVGDVYASPLLTATRGATHGYHVTDPRRTNPEVGGDAGLRGLARALDAHRMGLLLDIVPNHLAASTENPWWVDVLEHGAAAVQAPSFDVDWEAADGRVVLPVLGAPLDEVVAAGEVGVGIDEDGLHLRVQGTRLPLDPATYRLVVGDLADVEVPPRTAADEHAADRRAEATEELKRRLVARWRSEPPAVEEPIAAVNRDPRRLTGLVDAQVYDLRWWRTGTAGINYRRFFDITDLVGVRVEDPDVFAARHHRLLELVADGTVTGFRVDHVDGLRDPEGYLRDLQAAASAAAGTDRFYVVVEKIVEGDEPVPETWPVAGTTGYEFLVAASALQVDRAGLDAIGTTYEALTGRRTAVADTVHARKVDALEQLFRGEVAALAARLVDLAGGALEEEAVRAAVVAVTACFPVYRTYVRGPELPDRDRRYLDAAFTEARRRHPDLDPDALAHVERVLCDPREETLDLVARWQQLTGPAMAKGFEDTTFYVENRLVSLNEVGVDVHGIEEPPGVEDFHAAVAERGRRWPHALNATSTHDTKRSEDTRARLNVLSEVPDRWADAVGRWLGRHGPPDRNEGWLLLQTLVGLWPLDPADEAGVRDRLHTFGEKAAREAKVNTNWLDPDERYEAALHRYVDDLLDDRRFVDDLRSFVDTIAVAGAVNSLAQLVLKLAAPGVPDLYQGTELWALTVVDPDNRRPVGAARRRALLDGIDGVGPAELLGSWRDGRVKLAVTRAGLRLRRERPELFARGAYVPLRARGPAAGHVVAFARRLDDGWVVAIVPRLPYRLAGGGWPLGEVWAGTELDVPEGAPPAMVDAVTGRRVDPRDLPAALAELPVALLHTP